ncbi:MAG: hypothetical protein AAGH65_05855 [Pseudomonadota bacterium]
MTNFSDPKHHVAELIYQGVAEKEPASLCDTAMLEALNEWITRKNPCQPESERFHLPQTVGFMIGYTGQTSDYWPDEESNFVSETLLREFLFDQGICKLDHFSPQLYVAHYKILAVIETEYLLVCPYPTAKGSLAGVIAVCINKHLHQDLR